MGYTATTSEDVFGILYQVRILKMAKTVVANNFNVHRNTVAGVITNYKDYSDDFIKGVYEDKDLTQEEFDELFGKRTRRKILALDRNAIAECCEKYLNCNLSAREYAKKLCEEKGVPFHLIIQYDPQKINENEYPGRKDIMSEIQVIRRRTAVSKNYSEVFDRYTETDRYKANPISCSTFKKYLQENESLFWKEKKWLPNLGKCIDLDQ